MSISITPESLVTLKLNDFFPKMNSCLLSKFGKFCVWFPKSTHQCVFIFLLPMLFLLLFFSHVVGKLEKLVSEEFVKMFRIRVAGDFVSKLSEFYPGIRIIVKYCFIVTFLVLEDNIAHFSQDSVKLVSDLLTKDVRGLSKYVFYDLEIKFDVFFKVSLFLLLN